MITNEKGNYILLTNKGTSPDHKLGEYIIVITITEYLWCSQYFYHLILHRHWRRCQFNLSRKIVIDTSSRAASNADFSAAVILFRLL
jgi:hypothetical protein